MTGEPSVARELLERKWFQRMERDPSLSALVTSDTDGGEPGEPFHRWLPYKQAFSPALVRRFLSTAEGIRLRPSTPLLDPFAGTGTMPVECARQAVHAVGIEALASLVFLASVKGVGEVPALPDLTGCTGWQQMAERLVEPIHRAALICAVAGQYNSTGRRRKHPPPLTAALGEVITMMGDDLRTPLPLAPRIERGDARNLSPIDDGSIGGMLTSPPYLSRYDYTKATRPHETVYRYWYPGRDLGERRDDQIRAHPKAYRQRWTTAPHPAVAESIQALAADGHKKLAGVVRSYFDDLARALQECARVLGDGGPCWMVIGGARMKGVYIPSDTILADLAETVGFHVSAIRIARQLAPTGRKLGRLKGVAPRESILILRKPG